MPGDDRVCIHCVGIVVLSKLHMVHKYPVLRSQLVCCSAFHNIDTVRSFSAQQKFDF